MKSSSLVQTRWTYSAGLRAATDQPVSREDIDRLLLDKLPEVLTQAQKLNRIHNLLRQLAEGGVIVNSGSRRWLKWVLAPVPEG